MKLLKQKEKKAHLALQYLIEKGKEIPSKWKKVENSNATPTPASVINDLGQQIGEPVKFDFRGTESGFFARGFWRVDNKDLQTGEIGPFQDKKYLKHKVALTLFHKASNNNDLIWESYIKLQKENEFVERNAFPFAENENVELKGAESGTLTSKHAGRIIKENFKTIAAMLNTGGGSMYIGVNGKDLKVQGVCLSNGEKDQILLSSAEATKHVDPAIELPQPRFHKVISKISTSAELYIIELKAPKSSTLHWYKDIVYVRVGSSSFPMPTNLIKERIRNEFQN